MEITIQELLKQLTERLQAHSQTATLDAQVLVAHHLSKPRAWVLAHPEVRVKKEDIRKISQSASQIEAGEPLPYILGHWEFFGLDFALTPQVLIPRPETELLVEKAIQWLQQHPRKQHVADVGTGSGCIGISLAKHIPGLHILLTDISAAALDVARLNAEKHLVLGRLEFKQADLLEDIPGTFDLICANLPYIPTSTISQLPVGAGEPRSALDGGDDGLEVIARLLDQAAGQLASGGLMLLEMEASQGMRLMATAKRAYPQSRIQIHKDLAGLDRCLEIERPDKIVHLCPRHEWSESQRLGEFRDHSLLQNGFIHCSQPEQAIDVANRYYQGVEDMVMLWIDPEKLEQEIRWEKSGGGYYPHVYGPIDLQAVETVSRLSPDRDGIYRSIQD
jgi:release factor glutamine methyltransferase